MRTQQGDDRYLDPPGSPAWDIFQVCAGQFNTPHSHLAPLQAEKTMNTGKPQHYTDSPPKLLSKVLLSEYLGKEEKTGVETGA